MKAVKMEFEDGELVDEERTDLTEAVVNSIESVDFYTGRDDYSTLTKLLESHARLIGILVERGILNVYEVNDILKSDFISIDKF